MQSYFLFATFLFASIANCYAYFENYPPFKFDKGPFPQLKTEAIVDFDNPEYRSEDGKIIARLEEEAESLDFLVQDGNIVLARMPERETPMPWAVYRADLDKNGLKDFIIFYSYRGCGLAASADKVEIFLKKEEEQYQKISYDVMSAGIEDFTDLNNDGQCEVIITDFYSGKKHNYFTYSIYEFKDYKLVNADSKFSEFPKFVWITYKPNDKDTTHLTADEKTHHVDKKNKAIRYGK